MHPALPGALLAALLYILNQSAFAIYRCEQQGQITYTDLPCSGTELNISTARNSAPEHEKDTDKLAKEKSEVARLQKLREQREHQDQQIHDLAVRGAALREKKCRSLALKLKWRQEDVREAPLHSQQKARTKERRAAETYQNECR